MNPVDRLDQIKSGESPVSGHDIDYMIQEIESLRAQVEKMREALELALSLCPKGPVYDGMDPTFYHTLNYKDECKLQERIDAARDLLATLKASGEGE